MIQTYLNTFQMGIVAGMRSLSAPALVAHKLAALQPDPLPGSKLHFMASPKTATVLTVLAGGELIGDKVPSAPDRTEIQPLSFRIASGAVCGAALSEAEGKQVKLGAVLGGLGAVVGAYAFFRLRHWLTHEQSVPDPLVALVEDALAIGAGLWTLNESKLGIAVV